MRALAVAALAIGTVVGLGACGGGSDEGPDATGTPAGPNVVARNMEFRPATIAVKAGETVTWQFKDTVPHNVVADDKSFESKLLTKGTFTHTFARAGSFPYICTIHPTMKGTVTVS